jgi:cobalt transporter subunit CbtA
MLKNLILSAAAAGVAAGLFTAVVQHVTTTPIIIEAEKYEGGGHSHAATAAPHGHAARTPAHVHSPGVAESSMDAAAPAVAQAAEEADWAPTAGLERTFYTSLATTVLGVGFALALLGAMILAGVPIDARRGLAFGAAGFVAVALAPAMGLPPEIPGSGAAALDERQLWWLFAAAATAAGLAGLLLTRHMALQIGGVVMIALPHLVGAPRLLNFASTAPAELAGHFVATSLAVTATFWGILGYFSGAFYERFSRAG